MCTFMCTCRTIPLPLAKCQDVALHAAVSDPCCPKYPEPGRATSKSHLYIHSQKKVFLDYLFCPPAPEGQPRHQSPVMRTQPYLTTQQPSRQWEEFEIVYICVSLYQANNQFNVPCDFSLISLHLEKCEWTRFYRCLFLNIIFSFCH